MPGSPQFDRWPLRHRAVAWLLVALTWTQLAAPLPSMADELLLRNLERLTDVTVAAIDVDGVLLVGKRQIGWGELLDGRISPDQQAEFDRLLAANGLPLYRIQLRLSVGDDRSLGDALPTLLDTYADRSSSTAALVWYAAYRFHLANEERAEALQCWLELHRLAQQGISAPNRATLNFEMPQADSGPSPELPPLWFDTAAAARVLPTLTAARTPEQATTLEQLCVASLAVGAANASVASQWIDACRPQNETQAAWRDIIRLQIENLQSAPGAAAKRVETQVASYPPLLAGLAQYELARAQSLADPSSQWQLAVLTALTVPAQAQQYPDDLVGACLALAAEVFDRKNDTASAQRLRRELRERFPTSWHAKQLRSQ